MTTLILTALLLVLVLIYGFLSSFRSGLETYGDDAYRDSNGDHIYYERSIIEKKLFRKLHPKSTLRSFTKILQW